MDERTIDGARRSLLRRSLSVVTYMVAAVVVLLAGIIAWYFATLYTASPRQQGYLALTHATVLAGEDLEPHANTTLLIRDGVIIAMAQEGQIDIPDAAHIMDLAGYTVMPGLIDMHVHLSAPEMEIGQRPNAARMLQLILDAMRFVPDKRRALLANGVTTVRDLGNEFRWVMELRRLIRNGELEGPRLFAAGPVFTTPGGHPVATLGLDPQSDAVRLPATAEEAREAVRRLAEGDDRVDLIKVVQERGAPWRALQPIPIDVLRAIVVEAHDQGLTVTAHWGTPEDLQEVLAAGVDGLEHIEHRGTQQGWPSGILPLLVERNIPLTPTLTATHVIVSAHISGQLRRRVAEFHAAGGRVLAGTDAGMPGVPFGPSIHRSMQLLVESGLTPREALKSATSESARALRTDLIGSVASGRAADLLVVVGDPLESIEATRNVALVFRDGRLVVDRRHSLRLQSASSKSDDRE